VDHLDRIAREWSDRAPDLARWALTHLVNRTDVWGRYVYSTADKTTQAVTAPFRDTRGKTFLDIDSLAKHFRTRQPGGQLGVHSASSDLTSRWLAIDVDRHDPDDEFAVTAAGNLAAVRGWQQTLVERGFDPLLLDSNGIGGYHLLAVFAEPMGSASVHEFGSRLVADFERRGLDQKPEVFPDKPTWDRYGDWFRLPGRHHTRPHYTRVWNDEPYAESQWLAGNEAIDRILATRPTGPEVLTAAGITKPRRTVCLDFDGVLHSYRSGWCGAEIIPDPPIHGTRQAIARLRELYRVVVHSTRCGSPEGRQAVIDWLRRNGIVVDEVCEHKPPALVYVDDRAIRFRGDWDKMLDEIREFRK
jgi:hypothetical protein